MGSSASLILISFLSLLLCLFLQPTAASLEDQLAPLFSPIADMACDNVKCGKGECKMDSHHPETLGFVCECYQGWTQAHVGDLFRFMPCVVPNCSFDISCTNASSPPPPAPLPHPTNGSSIFDVCNWAYCGEGSCTKTSQLGHKCNCNRGYSNLFNVSYYPCFKDCAFEGECANLGIGLSNSSSASPSPRLSDKGSPANQGESKFQVKLVWPVIFVISLVTLTWI